MKNLGTELSYKINGAKFSHRYDHPADALTRAAVLVANGVAVRVRHFALRSEK